MLPKSKAPKNSTETSSQLAKQYREIGIKAVAAALQTQDAAQQSRVKDDYQPQKTNRNNARENADE
jgi:hypothetical protein